MGQAIEVDTAVVGDAAIFTTDRSITGQDGVSYDSAEAAGADERFPGMLAARLYQSDEGLGSVFVASNQVVAQRDAGWDETATAAAATIIEDFFLFYPAQ